MDYKIHKRLCLIITVPDSESNSHYQQYLSKVNEYKEGNLKVVIIFYRKDKSNQLGKYINTSILLNNKCDYYVIHDYSSIPSNIPDYLYTNYPIIIDKNILIINKNDLVKTNGFSNNETEENIYQKFENILRTDKYYDDCFNKNNYGYYSEKINEMWDEFKSDLVNIKENIVKFANCGDKRFVYDNIRKNPKVHDYLHRNGLDQIEVEEQDMKINTNGDLTKIIFA